MSAGSNENFDSVRDIEERNVAKPKTSDEQFKEMMDRCIARWDNGKIIKLKNAKRLRQLLKVS